MSTKLVGNLNFEANQKMYAPVLKSKDVLPFLLSNDEMQIQHHIEYAVKLSNVEFGKVLRCLRVLSGIKPEGLRDVMDSNNNLSSIENGTRTSSAEKRDELIRFVIRRL